MHIFVTRLLGERASSSLKKRISEVRQRWTVSMTLMSNEESIPAGEGRVVGVGLVGPSLHQDWNFMASPSSTSLFWAMAGMRVPQARNL